MATEERSMRWGAEQRLEFIDFQLYWEGTINRSHIMERFGVSVPQASTDLSQYRESAPANLIYDTGQRRYVATPEFQPVFIQPNAERYLAQLRAISENIISVEDTMMVGTPSVDVTPVPSRRVTPEVLRSLLNAVRQGRSINIKYQSMDDLKPKPTLRSITPHAVASDGLRWHVRAYCSTEKRFRDFIISRCLEIGALGEPEESSTNDRDWNTKFDVVLIPNPKLSKLQRQVIELDYGMAKGRATVSVRYALLYYFDKRLRLDVAEQHDRPRETPVVVENRTEYDAKLKEVAT